MKVCSKMEIIVKVLMRRLHKAKMKVSSLHFMVCHTALCLVHLFPIEDRATQFLVNLDISVLERFADAGHGSFYSCSRLSELEKNFSDVSWRTAATDEVFFLYF